MFDKFFSTSEFAKIVGVSKHTLFYYDKEKVFCPEHKNENGFRTYSVFQIETFLVIKSLTEIGLTLAMIKEYLKTRSGENCMALLDKHEKIIDKKINRLKRVKELLREKKETITEYYACKTDDVHRVFEKKQILFVTNSDENDYYTPFTSHIKNASDAALNLPSAVGHIIKNEDYMNKTYFDFYFSKVKTEGTSTMVKPEGEYLNYYHKNGYFTIESAYEKIIVYAQENNIILGDYFYEYMILDELAVSGIENYVVKISIAIKN